MLCNSNLKTFHTSYEILIKISQHAEHKNRNSVLPFFVLALQKLKIVDFSTDKGGADISLRVEIDDPSFWHSKKYFAVENVFDKKQYVVNGRLYREVCKLFFNQSILLQNDHTG